MKIKNVLFPEQEERLIATLKIRFEKNLNRHETMCWLDIEDKLRSNPKKLWSLNEMELTGGEPDVVGFDENSNEFVFYDCSSESPTGRRSLCFDPEALEARKKFKPKASAIGMAKNMGVELLTEAQYRELQKTGKYDQKTSSWIQTPGYIRQLGGALFADFRFNTTFVYHNGAESYYAGRGFRASLKI